VSKHGHSVTFAVPASTANLGPGYGVLAVGLDLPLHVEAEPRTDGELVVVRHDDPDAATQDPRHDTVLRGLRAAAEVLDVNLGRGLTVIVEGTVPRGAGLGTVSAGFAAGVGVAARLHLAGKRPEPIDRNRLLDALTEVGGDPAHGAGSLIGGLVATVPVTQPQEQVRRHRVLSFPLHESWYFVVAMSDLQMGTADTKRVLPPTLPHAVTPRSTGRVVGILHALANADEELLRACLFDEVHVPYRRRLVPGMEQALAAALEAGACGSTISGHGPGVLALTTEPGRTADIARAMSGAFIAAGQQATALVLRAARYGALPA
jgi:homoserine kinase